MVPENKQLTRDIMLQASAFIEKKHGFAHEDMVDYIDATIGRWSTPGVKDTVERIAKAPIRKLDPEDRMVKPAVQCEEYGLANDLILKGIAAAFLYDMDGDEQAAQIQAYISENGKMCIRDRCYHKAASDGQEICGSDLRVSGIIYNGKPAHGNSTKIPWAGCF